MLASVAVALLGGAREDYQKRKNTDHRRIRSESQFLSPLQLVELASKSIYDGRAHLFLGSRRLSRQAVAEMKAQRETELARADLATPCRKVLESLAAHWEGLTLFVDNPRIPGPPHLKFNT